MRSDSVRAVSMLLLLACSPGATSNPTAPTPTNPNGPRVIFPDGHVIRVELAPDPATREQGLMYRDRMPDGNGMLFFFPVTSEYAFWMKNVRMPLDIIWLDESHRVVWIVHEAPPCGGEACVVYQPPRNATFVIEVTGGFARLEGIRIGERVTISPR